MLLLSVSELEVQVFTPRLPGLVPRGHSGELETQPECDTTTISHKDNIVPKWHDHAEELTRAYFGSIGLP